jgi:hypothetical protein
VLHLIYNIALARLRRVGYAPGTYDFLETRPEL